MRSHRLAAGALLLALGALPGAAGGEPYPVRPIRFLVPSPPGGSPDILARVVGQKLAVELKQQVVVDNRSGASGVIGVELARRAAPDGYTLLLATSTAFASLPALSRSLPYDVEKDFIPISRIAWVANVLAVNNALGVAGVADLVRLARAKPGQLNFGSAGNGSPAHLAGAMFNVLAGVVTVHVPYKGAAPAIADLIGGQLQFFFTSPLVAMPHARAGRARVIATTSARRDPLLPELPPVAEAVPGYEIVQWWGIAVPAGTPAAVARRVHEATVAALNAPDARAAMTKNGATPHPESPADFAAFMRAERERIARLGRQAAITLD
ncbi:MAG: tripartite tricarboxylate transporter substrate binding protein [Burkholderiales bacterium]|nr:tripartite tricarboxylate transporter substrate binding protein [Burkholderiales bacterium]